MRGFPTGASSFLLIAFAGHEFKVKWVALEVSTILLGQFIRMPHLPTQKMRSNTHVGFAT